MQLQVCKTILSEFCEFCKKSYYGSQDIVTKMMRVRKSSFILFTMFIIFCFISVKSPNFKKITPLSENTFKLDFFSISYIFIHDRNIIFEKFDLSK